MPAPEGFHFSADPKKNQKKEKFPAVPVI